jgi:hypothetical protein
MPRNLEDSRHRLCPLKLPSRQIIICTSEIPSSHSHCSSISNIAFPESTVQSERAGRSMQLASQVSPNTFKASPSSCSLRDIHEVVVEERWLVELLAHSDLVA